jgi:hypothetical protein
VNTTVADLRLAYYGRLRDLDGTVYFLEPCVVTIHNATVVTGDFWSIGDVVTTAINAVAYDFKFDRLPEWGWWTAYYPRHPVLIPHSVARAQRPMRQQARSCAKQRRQWKRRRFVQKLRRRA